MADRLRADEADHQPDLASALDSDVKSNNGLRIICLITHGDNGGAQFALRNLARALRRRGHEVNIGYLYGAADQRESAIAGRAVLDVQKPGLVGYLRIALRLKRWLKTERPDAVISFLPLANVFGQSAAFLTGVPARVASQRNPGWTYHPLMQRLDRLAGSLGAYTSNVANSQAGLESFAAYPPSYRQRLSVIRNGLEWKPSQLTRSEAREKFGLPCDVPVIVNVGRLSEQKNQAWLLKVLSQLAEVHLAIAGDGELATALAEETSSRGLDDRCHFFSHVEPRDIPDLLKAGDVFTLPSLYEGHCNALVEALSAGVPVVASDIPSNREALGGDKPAGFLLPLDDISGWSASIQRILGNEECRRELSARAIRHAAGFTLEGMAASFEACIEKDLKASNRSRKHAS